MVLMIGFKPFRNGGLIRKLLVTSISKQKSADRSTVHAPEIRMKIKSSICPPRNGHGRGAPICATTTCTTRMTCALRAAARWSDAIVPGDLEAGTKTLREWLTLRITIRKTVTHH
ncbi:hypothetical protein OO012_05910 [Rhodobacteraceae bacterium KMM 6894]|nr:hypothetical protein [Rhodobacteraceae bacterium KMM 6894]